MFGGSPFDDARRFVRATLTNQLARSMPSLYFKAVHDTGRGPGAETEDGLAQYALTCLEDYSAKVELAVGSHDAVFEQKQIIEYGPGDFPGAAILMLAHGAESVVCVDRFPLLSLSDFNLRTLECLLEKLPARLRDRVTSALIDRSSPQRGFAPDRLKYLVTKDGLAGLHGCVDYVFSRAVLEHVNDLPATFVDMGNALRPHGLAVHLVDLKSHRLHRENKLDFLTWPDPMWWLMFSAKGAPNRLRPDAYRGAITRAGLETVLMEPTGLLAIEQVDEIRPHLARRFKSLSDDDLRWEGFWLVLRKAAGGRLKAGSC